VRQNKGYEATVCRPADHLQQRNEQQQQGDAGNDFRHHERCMYHTDQQRAAREAAHAHQGGSGQCAEHDSDAGSHERHFQGEQCGMQHGRIVQQPAIPGQGKPAPHRH
jgi:arylamine N-acetyltransferase